MTTAVAKRIFTLLDAIKADFPRRKRASEELMKRLGVRKSLEMKIAGAEPVSEAPTFDPKVSRHLTPMLRARFEYASTWQIGQDIWLSAAEMASWMEKSDTQLYHRSLRENWDGSAPMLFADGCLTLFGITRGVPEDVTYLVWTTAHREPEVWTYAGFDSHRFKNLELYLKWCLGKKKGSG